MLRVYMDVARGLVKHFRKSKHAFCSVMKMIKDIPGCEELEKYGLPGRLSIPVLRGQLDGRGGGCSRGEE